MAGGGVSPATASVIVAQTGVRQLHASARKRRSSGMAFRRPGCFMGGEKRNDDDTEYTLAAADVEIYEAIFSSAREGISISQRF